MSITTLSGSPTASYVYNDCTGTTTGTGAATDGSGFSFDGYVVTAPDGKHINAPFSSQTSNGSVTDSNGTYVTNHGDGTFTDTLGQTALTITGRGTAASPRYFQYSTPTGKETVMVSYKTYTVQTVFGCGSVGEYNLSGDLVVYLQHLWPAHLDPSGLDYGYDCGASCVGVVGTPNPCQRVAKRGEKGDSLRLSNLFLPFPSPLGNLLYWLKRPSTLRPIHLDC